VITLWNDVHGRIGDDGGQVEELPDAKVGELLEFLDFCGFGKGQSILNIDTKAVLTRALREVKQDVPNSAERPR